MSADPGERPAGATSWRTSLGLELLALALLLGAVVRDRMGNGLQAELIALALALAPLHLARLLDVAGGRRWTGPLATACEGVVLLEMVRARASLQLVVAAVALSTALAAKLALARAARTSPAPRAGRVAARALVVLAVAWTLGEVAWGRHLAAPRALLALLLAAETFRRTGSGRSDADELLRATLALVALALGCLRGDDAAEGAIAALPALALTLLVAWSARVAPESRRAARVRGVARLLAVTTLLAGALALAEVAMRVVPNAYAATPAPTTTARPTFHVPGELHRHEGGLFAPRLPPELVVEFRWNRGGWHDEEHEREKPPGTARVLVLGDSFVEATMVPTPDLYHLQLARELAASPATGGVKVEAIALGWSGWSQVQELEALRREGLAYAPDLVVVEFLPGNDVRGNDPELEAIASGALWTTPARRLYARALEWRLLSLALVFDKLDLALKSAIGERDPPDGDVYREVPAAHAELWSRAWARTEDLLAEMQRACAAAGARLVVVVFTSRAEIDARLPGAAPGAGGYDYALPGRRVAAICERLGVPCLDLAARFAARPAEERARIDYLPYDGHWSPFGHRLGAEETARFLGSSGVWAEVLAKRR